MRIGLPQCSLGGIGVSHGCISNISVVLIARKTPTLPIIVVRISAVVALSPISVIMLVISILAVSILAETCPWLAEAI